QGSARGGEEGDDRIRRAGLGDPEPDAHDSGPWLVGERESGAELLAERVLEVADEAKQVVLRHRSERVPAAPPQRDGLEQHLVVSGPVGLRIPIDERDVTRRTCPQERVVVENPGRLLVRLSRAPRTTATCENEEEGKPERWSRTAACW